jgi:hypothetical protein
LRERPFRHSRMAESPLRERPFRHSRIAEWTLRMPLETMEMPEQARLHLLALITLSI